MIQAIAALIELPSLDAIFTVPSSSILILAPVFSTISRITLPPEPITSRILSVGIFIVSMRGANSPSSARALVERLGHFVQDMQAAVLGLAERDLHDLLGDAGDLDVHLQRGDAVLGARDLEVHVAEMVLVAENVGQHGEALAFEDQAHGDAGGRPLERHAGVHQRQRGAADRRHRRRAVGFGDLRHDADRVGEFRRGRQHRMNGAPGELAMADFAAAGRTHAAGLAHRIGREVVVEQEVFPDSVPSSESMILLVLAGAERRHHQGLGFAAGEDGGAMGARQNADLRGDRTYGA